MRVICSPVIDLPLEVLSILCRICLAKYCLGHIDPNTLISSLVISSIGYLSLITLTNLAMGHIRVGLDRRGPMHSIVTQLLLLVEHSIVVLRNLCLVPRDVIPVDLACATVHRSFVDALAVLLLWRHQCA